jgi:hypothetical protein
VRAWGIGRRWFGATSWATGLPGRRANRIRLWPSGPSNCPIRATTASAELRNHTTRASLGSGWGPPLAGQGWLPAAIHLEVSDRLRCYVIDHPPRPSLTRRTSFGTARAHAHAHAHAHARSHQPIASRPSPCITVASLRSGHRSRTHTKASARSQDPGAHERPSPLPYYPSRV